ncbi:MAG: organic radical activating enzyme [Bacteriovoracaceae bacterium]|jgi:organic radical activating enzyme
MLKSDLESIHVMPGLFCNYTCSHCVNDSGPKMTEKVSPAEIKLIRSDVVKFRPKMLQFSGGESSFYADEINQIVSSHPDIDNCEVILTSNGWYGKTKALTKEILDKFEKISKITLSFDVFHGNEAKVEYLNHIKEYASSNSIDLVVSFCISTPLDLIRAKKILENIDLPVIYQRVDNVGRAKVNQLGFNFSVFDENVLNETCPNIKCVSFVPEKGFSICCGNLMFNDDSPYIYHKDTTEHLESKFFKRLQKLNFGQILAEEKISISNLNASHSSPCSICEFIHSGERQ